MFAAYWLPLLTFTSSYYSSSMEQFEKIYLYKRIVQAKLFIDKNFAAPIDLDNIAGEAHFSKFHFIRLFKSIYGSTPNHYLIKTRIDKAKTLLADGHSILQTGLMVGLESPTSFAGMFKKREGISPSEYQKRALQKKKSISQNPFCFIPNCFASTHGLIK